MGNRTRFGKLVTAHTVGSVHPSYAGVFNVSNAAAINKYDTFSNSATSNPGNNLYTYVTARNINYNDGNGTFDVALNWGISVSTGDTVYFSFHERGVQVSKVNVDVTTGNTRKLLLDSRIRRRGIIYATGNFSSLSTTASFNGNKTDLAYIPLVITREDKVGNDHSYSNNSTNDEDYTEKVDQYIFTKTSVTPSEYYFDADNYDTRSTTSVAGDTAMISGRTKSGASCTNFNFKVLRIPCAYGYMTSANFDTPLGTGSNTSGYGTNTSSGKYKLFGKKRVVAGKLTNSNAGLSNNRGMFVSREGTDVTTCGKDDFVFASDTGIVATEQRGEVQNLATNYSSVTGSTTVEPTTTSTTNISSSSTGTISVYNPYTLSPTTSSTFENTSGSSSLTTSVSGTNTLTYTFSTTSTSTISLQTAFYVESISFSGSL